MKGEDVEAMGLWSGFSCDSATGGLVFLFVGRADFGVQHTIKSKNKKNANEYPTQTHTTWVVCFAVGAFVPICNME